MFHHFNFPNCWFVGSRKSEALNALTCASQLGGCDALPLLKSLQAAERWRCAGQVAMANKEWSQALQSYTQAQEAKVRVR